jgi:hypothetical protein
MSDQLHAPLALTPAKEPHANWTEGWVDDVEKRQIFSLARFEIRPLNRRYIDCTILDSSRDSRTTIIKCFVREGNIIGIMLHEEQ